MKKVGELASKAREVTREVKGRFAKDERSFPKAYPSDTYLADLDEASKTPKSWTRIMPLVILLSVIADFYLLQDSFATMLDTANFEQFLAGEIDGIFTMLICLALVVLYLAFGHMAGHYFANFRAFRNPPALAAFIACLVVVSVVLVLVAYMRYYGTDFGASGMAAAASGGGALANDFMGGAAASVASTTGGDDRLSQTICLMLAMLLGAVLSVVHAACNFDPFALQKKELAEVHIAEDATVYAKAYASVAVDSATARAYEQAERELDARSIDCAFRLTELSACLNGIVDPADAQEFQAVGRLVNERILNREG